jgi:DNA-binding transcriptional ArsR family regulator
VLETHDRQLNALGDSTRRTLLRRLRQGPLPVVELARGMTISRPAVSQHLRILKDAGLVKDEARGARRLYSLDARGFALLRQMLDEFCRETAESQRRATP